MPLASKPLDLESHTAIQEGAAKVFNWPYRYHRLTEEPWFIAAVAEASEYPAAITIQGAEDVANCSHPHNLVEDPKYVATKTVKYPTDVRERKKDVVNPTYLHSIYERPWPLYSWDTKHCYLCLKDFKNPARLRCSHRFCCACLKKLFREPLLENIWEARGLTGVCKIPDDLTDEDLETMRAALKNPERTFGYQCPRCYKPCTTTPCAERETSDFKGLFLDVLQK